MQCESRYLVKPMSGSEVLGLLRVPVFILNIFVSILSGSYMVFLIFFISAYCFLFGVLWLFCLAT